VLLAVEIDDLPAKPVKLIEKGFFDMVALVELDVMESFLVNGTSYHYDKRKASFFLLTYPLLTNSSCSSNAPGFCRWTSQVRISKKASLSKGSSCTFFLCSAQKM